MAHTKTGASIRGSRKSISKRLGVKKYAGETVIPGNIIVRQRGTEFKPGVGVKIGKDFTISAYITGKVLFKRKKDKMFINVV